MPQKHIKIADGDVINGIKVIEIINGALLQDTEYRIKRPCCGRIETVGHKPLTAMKKKGARLCRRCAMAVAAKKGLKQQKPKALTKATGKQVYVPGWGLTLGSFRRYT